MELPPGDISPWVQMLSKTLYEINSTRAPVENWEEVSLLADSHFEFFRYAINYLSAHGGASQNFQDAWASFRCDGAHHNDAFFVEFGAFDGVYSSNTIRLQRESYRTWRGILAEPNPQWSETLRKERAGPGISINTSHCVTGRTGELVDFVVTADPLFSGIGPAGPSFKLPTISLNDLLRMYNAPSRIDFMSVDTEGSEYEILRCFDFHAWNVRNICVEHNFLPAREDIYRLMTANGYRREFEAFSRWDDFYTKEKL